MAAVKTIERTTEHLITNSLLWAPFWEIAVDATGACGFDSLAR
jgi:hypothetical protein